MRGEYTYAVPPALAPVLRPGQRIRVPFGRASTLAFSLGPAAPPSAEAAKKLKPIERTLEDAPALSADIVELVRFAAAHYRYPLGEALRAAPTTPCGERGEGRTNVMTRRRRRGIAITIRHVRSQDAVSAPAPEAMSQSRDEAPRPCPPERGLPPAC